MMSLTVVYHDPTTPYRIQQSVLRKPYVALRAIHQRSASRHLITL